MMNGDKGEQSNDLHPAQSQPQKLETISSQNLVVGNENAAKTSKVISTKNNFDQPLALTQSPKWIQTILWTLLGSLTVSIIWASVAKLEETIPAQGKLEPEGVIKEVRLPSSGTLIDIRVEEGKSVKAGDLLLKFDSTAANAQLAALQKLRKNLQQENQFYRDILSGKRSQIDTSKAIAVPAEFFALARSREVLASEMQLYRMQVNGGGADLSGDQQDRLNATRAELSSRSQAAEANIAQSLEQLNQTRINRTSKTSALAIEKDILKRIENLCKAGAASELQCLKQQQLVQTNESEIRQLAQEEMRIQAAITEGQARLNNTFDITRKELTSQLSDNTKRIADIDSQFTKALVDNSKRLSEIEGQILQTEVTVKNQELHAPTSGTVFELKVGKGYVANGNAGEIVLKIVPDDLLVAKVFISNQNIGFVKEGMSVDIRIDSFPFTEFGYVPGKLISIGSDVLPPDQTNPTYRFPAKVQLERQSLENKKNGSKLNLKSGMSLTANIKTLRDRTVISLFTDTFTKVPENLQNMR